MLRAAGLAAALAVPAAHAAVSAAGGLPQEVKSTTLHRTRLMLKDGTYQVVTSYRVVGAVVRYRSAERGGEEEEVPLALVDMDATHRWEQRHAVMDADGQQQAGPPPIDPELLKEEADRAALTPEVAPDLSLPLTGSVYSLDTFQGRPELVPMPQAEGELNRVTAHATRRGLLNRQAAPHAILTLRGERAVVQLHVESPMMYVRLGDDAAFSRGGGAPYTVDTHGASGQAPTTPTGGAAGSRYAIVRLDVRTAARVMDSFEPDPARPADEVTWARTEVLPGGHWMRLSPESPLPFGEYALVEVLSDRELNLNVWDFGVHPVAPENRDAVKPEPKRRVELEPRRPE